MKRILLICMMLFTVMAVNAQTRKGFISTGDRVNVRKGPKKTYPVIIWEGNKLQLDKGETVSDKGKRKNGFCYVNVCKVVFGSAIFSYDGWVSAQYLRPVTLCPECDGLGYVGDIEDMTECPKCKSKGHL